MESDYNTPVLKRTKLTKIDHPEDVMAKNNGHPDLLIDKNTLQHRYGIRTPSFMHMSMINASGDSNRIKKLDKSQCCSNLDLDDKTSPSLSRLRMTPGLMREKQKNLINQHKEILQKGSHLQAGGGISIWPEMHQMRLTQSEFLLLLLQVIVLCGLTLVLLNELHGETFSYLKNCTNDVKQFCEVKVINESHSQDKFHSQVTQWHNDFLYITDSIHSHFDLTSMSASYQVYISAYMMGLLVLLYYLMDNMLARNKLTPSRVKKWTCLLVVIGSWTCTMAYCLFLASQLERQMIICIQKLSSYLGTLVSSPLNLDTFQAVLLYWRTRFLESTSLGILNLFGIIPIRDLVHYLQYYSVPIATVLLSPVLQLCCACLAIYSQGEYVKTSE